MEVNLLTIHFLQMFSNCQALKCLAMYVKLDGNKTFKKGGI